MNLRHVLNPMPDLTSSNTAHVNQPSACRSQQGAQTHSQPLARSSGHLSIILGDGQQHHPIFHIPDPFQERLPTKMTTQTDQEALHYMISLPGSETPVSVRIDDSGSSKAASERKRHARTASVYRKKKQELHKENEMLKKVLYRAQQELEALVESRYYY